MIFPFLSLLIDIASDKAAMRLWFDNQQVMKELDVFEESLLHAWSRQRVAGNWSAIMLASLLLGDRHNSG